MPISQSARLRPLAAWAKIVEPFSDGIRSQRGNPKSADRLFAFSRIVDVAEDQFAFPPSIRRAYYPRHPHRRYHLSHHFELILGCFVANTEQLMGKDRQQIHTP